MSLNCIIIDDDPLSRKIIEGHIKKLDTLNFIQSFESPIDAFNLVKQKQNIDLIFLDIVMPEMTGLEFLSTFDIIPAVILISSEEKYALASYEFDVIDYLLKPVSFSRFYKAIEKVNSRIAETKSGKEVQEDVFFKIGSKLIKFNINEILLLESMENYVIIYTSKEKHTVHFTLKAAREQLPQDTFLQVHKSYIVNSSRIELVEENSIIIKVNNDTKVVPIGKAFKENFFSAINLIKKK